MLAAIISHCNKTKPFMLFTKFTVKLQNPWRVLLSIEFLIDDRSVMVP